MYIPVTYWNNQLATRADLNIRYFTFSPVQNFSYTYDNITISGSATTRSVSVPVCMDVVEAEDIVLNKPNIAGSSFFCNASFIGSSQCCINSYPNTGVEAWYCEISYSSKLGNVGLQYYNYINQNGDIVNDSIAFGQTKTIISQCNPMALREAGSNFFGVYVNWRITSKFPGQVLAYPFKDVPCDYTLQLKRDSAQSPGSYFFPRINWQSLNDVNGFWSNSPSASTTSSVAGALNSTITIGSAFPPLDAGSVNNSYGSAVWITNVTPKPKGALLLSSCSSTHSLWVTLNNSDYYQTASVLQVTNAELTTTSSCWTVSNVTSSLAISVALNDVNVSQSYPAGQCPECAGATKVIATGGTTGSFVSGSTLYNYNVFTSNGQFTIMSGSITDAKVMVIAGGGGGGSPAGGGAGGLVYSSSVSLNLVGPSNYYAVTVGQGGAPYNGTIYNQSAANGGNSTFVGSPYNIVAIGGGRGASQSSGTTSSDGGNGGSGGGGNFSSTAGLGTAGQGNNGGNAGFISSTPWPGGGGGAGSAGSVRFAGAGVELGSLMFGVSGSFCSGGRVGDDGSLSTTSGSGGRGASGIPAQAGLNGLVVITYPAYSY